MKKQFKWIWPVLWLVICLFGGGGTLFSWMPRTPAMFYGGLAMLTVACGVSEGMLAMAMGKPKSWLRGMIGGVAALSIMGAVTLLCDHVLFPGKHVYASLAVTLLNYNYYLYLIIRMPKQVNPGWHIVKRAIALVLAVVSLILCGFTQNFWWSVEQADLAIAAWKPTEHNFVAHIQQDKTPFDEGEFIWNEHDLMVSPDGDDSYPGTQEQPLKTLEAAKEKAREGATVWFRAGTYLISKEIVFGEEDAQNVTYRSMPGEEVVFTGSVAISDWKNGTINGVDALVADVDTDNWYFRSLFMDGERLQVSTWPKEGTFKVADSRTEDSFHPDSDGWKVYGAFYVETDEIMNFANPEDVIIRLSHYWLDDIMSIHSVDTQTGRIELSRGAARDIKVGDPFVYENVRETLSEPGEWYLNRSEGKLYYIPRADETAENTTVYAPVTNSFLRFDGASNIRFQGVSFENSDWELFNGEGPVYKEDHPLYQNMKYTSGAYQANLGCPAAITVMNSDHIDFVDCAMENVSFVGIKFDENVRNCSVEACAFHYMGGSAVVIGNSKNEIPAQTGDISVTDCLVEYYGRVFNQSVGIHLIFAENCTIANNEIHDGYYTGISAGWVWGYGEQPTRNTKIQNNLIYNIGVDGLLSDLGGIYLLGYQPGSVLSGNVIYNVGCYDYGANGIYLDAGSSGWIIENNLVSDCATQCFTTAYGRDNVVCNNIFAYGNRWGFYVGRADDVSDECALEFHNNIVVVDDTPIMEETIPMEWFAESGNILWDYSHKTVYNGLSMHFWQRVGLDKMKKSGHFEDALIVDPGFADPEKRNFTLTDAVAGFIPWETSAGNRYTFD